MDQVRGVDCAGRPLRQLDEIIVSKTVNISLHWYISMTGVSCSARADRLKIDNFRTCYDQVDNAGTINKGGRSIRGGRGVAAC